MKGGLWRYAVTCNFLQKILDNELNRVAGGRAAPDPSLFGGGAYEHLWKIGFVHIIVDTDDLDFDLSAKEIAVLLLEK